MPGYRAEAAILSVPVFHIGGRSQKLTLTGCPHVGEAVKGVGAYGFSAEREPLAQAWNRAARELLKIQLHTSLAHWSAAHRQIHVERLGLTDAQP
jgi:hypothetical protein